LPRLDFDWLVAAWSLYDVAAPLEHYAEFAGAALGTFALGDLILVELIVDPNAFANHSFGKIGARNFASRESINP